MSFALTWPPAHAKQELSQGQLHVWGWSLVPGPNGFDARDLQSLDAGERARYERYHFAQDCVRFAIAHIGLRRILAMYLDCRPDQVRLRASRLGKPAVETDGTYPPLYFNLSHSRHIALLAISAETEVGVDIEDVRPIEVEVAQHYFSPLEQEALSTLQGDAWLDGFYRCWTRKEAILKAEGVGLQVPLTAFDVSILPHAPAALLGVRPPVVFSYPWKLHDLSSPAGTIAALAAGNPQAKITCFRLAL